MSKLLADTYTLYLMTHNYHWNVTGPMFTTLHLLFEQQYNELALAVDEIAEGIALSASRHRVPTVSSSSCRSSEKRRPVWRDRDAEQARHCQRDCGQNCTHRVARR
ncbi:MAG TPA: ferritin-like domain-containing protein [Acidimicrobiales bacterium]|nr:ferritin-like domain-containing protein [Acidimicrobiales bacterium]